MKGMLNSIPIQGCKRQSLIKDCSKTIQPMMKFSQLICRDELHNFGVKIKKNCMTGFELFLISHFLSSNGKKSALQIFILHCSNVKCEPIF